MAESVVSFAVETIGNLLIDEAKFLWGVEGKVEDLQKELGLIQGFLRDADSRREHSQAVGEWVAQLRDIAYDAEDVIEQYILRVASKKGQNIIKSYACFVAKCTCMQVHGVGTKIEGLKSSISNLRMSMQGFGIQSVNKDEREQARASMPRHTYAHVEENIVGREDSIKELVKELKDGKHRVVSIWGMGGLGKTTLAKKVFNHDEVKSNFKGSAWACVSQQYHVKDILVGILVKLIPDQRQSVMEMRDDELFETLYKIQQEERYLVVLDDIWTKQDWNGIRAAFPVENMRSKLLITTRNRVVPKYIDPHGFLYEPRYLSNQESWELLMNRVFPKTKTVGPSSVRPQVDQGIAASQPEEGIASLAEMEGQIPIIPEKKKRLGDQLLKKCEGLPLAIIVLGGLLAVNEWETVHKNINLHLSDSSDVSKVLALSYDDLPWYLKPCFLYLGSFPEDAEIPAMEVLHMWIAEGFVSLKGYDKGREIQVEDVAEQYLLELFERGMVQVRFKKSGKMKTCHLHDMMRELCVSKALQESFLNILNIQQDNEMENCSASVAIKAESSCKIRRLSLNGNVIPNSKASGRTLVHLRTLMFFRSYEWDNQFQSIFEDCKFLRVLKLEDLDGMRSLPKSVGDLVHLRFLSIKDSDFLGLPRSMGNLVCMEFLDMVIKGIFEVSIPNVLWKMTRLRYLGLPYKFFVEEKHSGQKELQLSTLKNLRTLRNFSPDKCDVNDVGKLTNLQKLIVIWNDMEIFPKLAEFNLKHLRSSSFYMSDSYKFWTESELSEMSNYPHSCKLSISAKIEKLPEHKSLPQQLRKLVLQHSKLKEDPMLILEKLENLVFLMLAYNAFLGKEMVCSAGGFPQLKHLLFYNLSNLEEWRAAEGAVSHLSRLGIKDCPKLRAIPSHLSTYDSTDEMLKEVRKGPALFVCRENLEWYNRARSSDHGLSIRQRDADTRLLSRAR